MAHLLSSGLVLLLIKYDRHITTILLRFVSCRIKPPIAGWPWLLFKHQIKSTFHMTTAIYHFCSYTAYMTHIPYRNNYLHKQNFGADVIMDM